MYTGCFTCELQIRSQGNAFVSPVVFNPEAEAELLRVWELVQATDVPGAETLMSARPHPFSSMAWDSELNPPTSTPTALGLSKGGHQRRVQEPHLDGPASWFFFIQNVLVASHIVWEGPPGITHDSPGPRNNVLEEGSNMSPRPSGGKLKNGKFPTYIGYPTVAHHSHRQRSGGFLWPLNPYFGEAVDAVQELLLNNNRKTVVLK